MGYDSPILPMDDSTSWYETGPEAILADVDLATVIVRVQMASNALVAQFFAAPNAAARVGATHAAASRDIMAAIVISAAITNEALKLASETMPTLRPLAQRMGASPELLEAVGKLCHGQHPASGLLRRARKKLGFHWDADIVRKSVEEYAANKTLVWLEVGSDGDPVQRMGLEVLTHALFPNTGGHEDTDRLQTAIGESVEQLRAAMRLIFEFFTAAIYGFMLTQRATRRALNGVEEGGS
jgi:hypothetical protein